MKKIVALLLVIAVLSVSVSAKAESKRTAAAKGSEVVKVGARDGGKSIAKTKALENKNTKASKAKLNKKTLSNKNTKAVKAGAKVKVKAKGKQKTQTKLENNIQKKKKQLNAALATTTGRKKNILKNQNKVRLAVHALLAVEGRSGGIGKNISAIARGLDNSVQSTIRAEEKIQTRGKLSRFLFGGDDDAAAVIDVEVAENRGRIKKLKAFKNRKKLDAEVKKVLGKQIKSLEAEQNRLSKLARNEKASRGLLGFLKR